MKTIILSLVVLAIGGTIIYIQFHTTTRRASQPSQPLGTVQNIEKEKQFERAKEITTPDAFINSDPFALADGIGKKVILLDFWTYSCINCQRTIPYLNSWYQKYKDEGLLIVGVHTPEFDFEKKKENVAEAVKKFGIQYPVVIDNDYSTWSAYGNQYWPRKYLIDIDGFIVYDHIGEGGYEETERRIQQALAERSARLGTTQTIAGGISTPTSTVTVDSEKLGSPEVYFGAARNSYLGNGTPGTAGSEIFTIPQTQKLNTLYLGGTWNITGEYAQNISAPARILFRYSAKNVYIVASSIDGAEVEVLRDGKPLHTGFGKDITTTKEGKSILTIHEDRLYHIIEDGQYGEHTLELLIPTKNLNAFTFTFG